MEIDINEKILHMLSIGGASLVSNEGIMAGEVEGWKFTKALDWTMQFLESWQSNCIIMYYCRGAEYTPQQQLYYAGKILLGGIQEHRASVEIALKTENLIVFLNVRSAERVQFDVSEDEDDPEAYTYCVTGYGKYSHMAYQLKEFDKSTVVYPYRPLKIREINYVKDENWIKRKLEKQRAKAEKAARGEQQGKE